VDAERAAILLEQAGHNVKVAIVMARRSVSAAEARRLLDAAGGFLRHIID
jgi:N-acetylmuramic acid 6-phosphate (MurNAc-6-P) etherase